MKTAAIRRGRVPAAARYAAGMEGLLTRFRRQSWRTLAAGPFYRHSLIGPTPSELRLKLNERWPGDARRGHAILAGDIEFSGEMIRHPKPAWFPAAAGQGWLAAWHGFDWLDDLIAAGTAGRDPARALVQSWISECAAWHPVAWRSDVAATRVLAWIVHFDEIAGRETDRALRRAMLVSIAAQVRHLARVAGWELAGAARLRALKGLLGGSAALGGSESRILRTLRAIERELPTQILPDGGHRTRNPSVQLQVMRDLIDVRAVLRAAGLEVPSIVEQTIERMAPVLRLFRHGDRRLALFNNSVEEDAILVDLALTRSETRGPAPSNAPHAGFQRLAAGQSLVLVDTGKPPPPPFDATAHAGMLSFELSQGRDRIVVNCGGYRGPEPAWRRASRASAAHSVLVVGDTNAAEIQSDGGVGAAPVAVSFERAEEGGHQWIAASHDGYRRRFGLLYSRELYLSADGDDLRGEEKLTGRPGVAFAVRFHLHPAVAASLAEDRGGALLRLPGGAVWRLRASGAELSLGDSVYLGSGEVSKTQQVVLSGSTGPRGTTVRWAIRREPKPPEPKPEADAGTVSATPSAVAGENPPTGAEPSPAAPAPQDNTESSDGAAGGPSRRALLALGAGAAALHPWAGRAQDKPLPVVGFLGITASEPFAPFLAAFKEGLRDAGFVDGQNVAIEYRWAEGSGDRLPALAAELVASNVDLIATSGGLVAAQVAKKATSTIPVVFLVGSDPVSAGLAASMSRPGGNLTGVTILTADLNPKRFELLAEMVPRAGAIALLVNPQHPAAKRVAAAVREAADARGVRLEVIAAAAEEEYEQAFLSARAKAGALLVANDPVFFSRRERLVELAARHAIPAMYEWREFVEIGGLMSYGTSFARMVRELGRYVGRVLAGAKPAELPVMQPTRFELAINMKTAGALRLAVPRNLLVRADAVIE